jgi:DNA-binding transcriptional LysR family regulator
MRLDPVSLQLFLAVVESGTIAGCAERKHLARSALSRLEDIVVQMREYTSGTRGLVRILANISSITQFLPQELKSFLEAHPQVKIELQESIRCSVHDMNNIVPRPPSAPLGRCGR